MVRAENAMLAGDLGAARKLYQKALKANPRHFAAWANLGTIHLQVEDVDKAEQAFSRALALQPDSVPVLVNLATLANQTGRTSDSWDLYRRALKLAPGDAEIWHDYARTKKFAEDDPDLAALEAMAAGAQAADDPANRMHAAYALGKAYEDIGRYDAAFDNLETANRLKMETVRFDLDSEKRFAERLIATFTPQFFTQRMGFGSASDVPVFVLGMPRSGTTLVEQILASHPEVHGAGEIDDLVDTVRRFAPGFPADVEALASADWRAMGDDYAAKLAARGPGARRVTDKMPRNFYLAGLIATALPNAHIVHCRRSAMDTCLSCYALHFPYGQEFSYDLTQLGGYYRVYMQIMEHWQRVLAGRMLSMDYEQLVADPETQARRLVEFCGLEWDEACLNFHTSKRSTATASATQVREPIYRRSVARWRRFERQLEPLRVALGPYAEDGGDGPNEQTA